MEDEKVFCPRCGGALTHSPGESSLLKSVYNCNNHNCTKGKYEKINSTGKFVEVSAVLGAVTALGGAVLYIASLFLGGGSSGGGQ